MNFLWIFVVGIDQVAKMHDNSMGIDIDFYVHDIFGAGICFPL